MFATTSARAASHPVLSAGATNIFHQETDQSYRPRVCNDAAASPFPLAPRARIQESKSSSLPSLSQTQSPAVPPRCRCYWAILALPEAASPVSSAHIQPSDIAVLEIVYVDPTLQAHLGPLAASLAPGQHFFDVVHPDDVQQARENMSDLLGPGKTTFGSVIRCRLGNVNAMRTQILRRGSNGTEPGTIYPSFSDEDKFPTVDLVISYVGDGLALCFMHNVVDESQHDSEQHNQSEWSNWCGMPTGLFTPEQGDMLWRQLSQKRSKTHRQSAPEHIFQILRSPANGGDILFSWPPPRLFPPIHCDNNNENSTRQMSAASAIGNSTLARYDDGSYFADDFATLAQSLDPGLFTLSDASTTCTRRLRARHTLATDGLIRTLESVVIGYGDTLIAMFTTVAQELIADASESIASLMPFPSLVPTPSQLQQPTDFIYGDTAAALEAQSQLALMSQSTTTLSPALLQQTLSPRQISFGFTAGDGAPQAGLMHDVDNLPYSAPADATSFSQGSRAQYSRHQEDQPADGDSCKHAGRRSFDESMLSPQKRMKSFGGQATTGDDRRMSDVSFSHKRAVTFNPDLLQTSSALSQDQQLHMDSELDGASTSRRYRNHSHGSFASSTFRQSLGTIISYDSLNASLASSETMFSPRQSMKWDSISGESVQGGPHRDSFASLASTTGLDAAAVAAAASAASAISTRRRSRQETWPLARIGDESTSALTSGASSVAGEAGGLYQPPSERFRSRSAAFIHTHAETLSSQMNAHFRPEDHSGSRLASSPNLPLDPSSTAASAAAAAAVTAMCSNGNHNGNGNDETANTSMFAMGIPGNSLNPYAAVPSPTGPSFSFGASPDVRPSLELPSVGVGSTTYDSTFGLQHSRASLPTLLPESYDRLSGPPSGVPLVTSFAPHCRALSAPGIVYGDDMIYTGTSRAQQYAGHLAYGGHVQARGGPGQKACQSCGTTSSPEWRRGPTGHKTLCNACGLRYSRSVLRAKKKAEKRKAAESSIRRASDVAADATIAAASAAANAAAAAAANPASATACADEPIRSEDMLANDEPARQEVFNSSNFHFNGMVTTAGPNAEAMMGVISSDGYPGGGPMDLALGLQLDGSGSGPQSYAANALGFEPPFLSSRTTTAASGYSFASTATSYASSASSVLGVGPTATDGAPGPHGSSSSSLTTSASNHSTGNVVSDGGGHPRFFGSTMMDLCAKKDHGLPVSMSEGAAEMERTTTADFMPFSTFGHAVSEGYEVETVM
ncbi:unnamed protein product [Tilletia controversa]|uniref:GATA-type domain-containing protein n=3 Tax=Tilletia TaxID=13289 RepID=A0A8X7MRW3_9BASI|nr:hypothetical protein CF336_g4779 [Tilletia laevis]KAE8194995.1 hypothetical protein CF328_g4578 [Tilletia controversa]KAE8258879.1 hypothetical protein A4X03_0g4257 [Tilletia caries]KAE8199164.1 hypothetical protein CF335_g4230 [Tilletia laevis]KAE8246632.1 hypothetical protein A4X06_0g4936 [Tilletia controversa]